jgi:1-acyl-sn-glycerol-3-phosphate acyltransferase
MIERTWARRLWYLTCQSIFRVGGMAAFGVRYYGLENVPRTGGLLVASNHQSRLDPPLIGAGFPRRMNYLARKTLFHGKLFSRMIAALDAIPIDRDGFGLGGVKETLRRLKAGEPVLVFPEGTRSPDGEIQKFKPGFAAIAVRAGASILPMAIEGAFAAMPRQSRLPRCMPVRVQCGVPIGPDEIAKYDEREIVALVEARVRECHALLRRLPVFADKTNEREIA